MDNLDEYLSTRTMVKAFLFGMLIGLVLNILIDNAYQIFF